MKVIINNRSEQSKKFPISIDISENATADQLKELIHKKFKTYYPDRQRLTFSQQLLQDKKTLKGYGIKDGDTILFKDLGPQISWRLVFFIEYLGPLILHPIFYYFKSQIYGQDFEHSEMQKIAYYMVMGHFIKRELETLFVHRFSHGTMPMFNVFKNSLHYHLLSGINLAYWVYGPWYANSERYEILTWSCILLYLFAEISNFNTHMALRNLRPPGTRDHKIPYGYGFNLVSCPNYSFEILAWISICILTKSLAAYLFTIVGSIQMYFWAIKKHKNYHKDFKEYPKNRKALIPFII
nr:4088_t:CDS:2 [Entrophospora candida]